ncbi:MAG: hypothetical protein A3K67_04855 [Euryarchaeota archaeon RBG_16_62_10]|nr:MAG: hypothetical protein A3K67_04855 [Euryarchaeota archaeon RBG_16_62_10]
MRPGPAFVALAVCALILTSPGAAGDIAEPGQPKYANNVLSAFVTPTVQPGQVVAFAFNVSNPYDEVGATMSNVTLTVGIYRYATQEGVRDVDAEFSRPPLIEGSATEINLTYGRFEMGRNVTVSLDITTSEKTPHGSYFSQSTYFVRFRLSFAFQGNTTPVVLQSRGWFTDEQWGNMVSFESGENIVNLTYMKSLGVDGLLPDSSFGLKVPIPRWPLGLLVAGCFGASFMALYYFVLDNPGRYPRLEKRFYYLRGKVSELRGELEDRLRK